MITSLRVIHHKDEEFSSLLLVKPIPLIKC